MNSPVFDVILENPNPITHFARSALVHSLLMIAAVAALYLILLHHQLKRSSRKEVEVPGPLQYPLIGNLPQLLLHPDYPNFPVLLAKMSQQYGRKLMKVKVGKVEAVVVSELSTAKCILAHPSVSNRGRDTMMDGLALGQNIGINFSNGDAWHGMRAYATRSLRKFEFGKASQSSLVLDEAEAFATHLKDVIIMEEEGSIRCLDLFDMTIFNLVWKSLGHEGFRLDEPKVRRMLKASSDFGRSTNLSVQLAEAFPALNGVVGGDGIKLARERLHEIHSFCRDTLKYFQRQPAEWTCEGRSSFFEDFASRIDSAKSDDSLFNADQFVVTLVDIFQNAVDGIGGTLTYALLYMMEYPDVKHALQAEVDAAYSYSSFVQGIKGGILDKAALQYTQAFILETLRHSSVIPVVAARQPKENIEFSGYHIRKGTPIVVNLYALNNSEKVWQDPDKFRPDRFLTSCGVLDEAVVRQVLMFEHGSRACPGKQFAEQTLLIYITVLLVRYFDWSLSPAHPTPGANRHLGITYLPDEFYAVATQRNF